MEGMIAQLRELADDPNTENVDALADAWEASLAKVQEAVAANTPAEGEPPAEEAPPEA
jgi:hypothetical protein